MVLAVMPWNSGVPFTKGELLNRNQFLLLSLSFNLRLISKGAQHAFDFVKKKFQNLWLNAFASNTFNWGKA